ncbi:hypothetical protein V2G26_020734 [Clonostachys chloroleuca]
MTSRKRNKGHLPILISRGWHTILLVCGAILHHCEATELYCINALAKLLKKNHQRLFKHERRPKGLAQKERTHLVASGRVCSLVRRSCSSAVNGGDDRQVGSFFLLYCTSSNLSYVRHGGSGVEQQGKIIYLFCISTSPYNSVVKTPHGTYFWTLRCYRKTGRV